jgi:hypothetical protein
MGRGAKRRADAGGCRRRFDPKVLVALHGGAFVERAGSAARHGPRLPILRGPEGLDDEQHRGGLSSYVIPSDGGAPVANNDGTIMKLTPK